MKKLTKNEQLKIIGGLAPGGNSSCSMTCKGGETISISDCGDICICSESEQYCWCNVGDETTREFCP